jgi:hypothetical protein
MRGFIAILLELLGRQVLYLSAMTFGVKYKDILYKKRRPRSLLL